MQPATTQDVSSLAVDTRQLCVLERRFTAAFERHFEYVWRLLRRLGVREALVDDAAQQVFVILSSKLGGVAEGKERAFLTATAFRVAANQRRSERRSFEVQQEGMLDDAVDPTPEPDQLLEQQRLRRLLDVVLDAMPLELRVVLVLFELEDQSGPEIARVLGLPEGTVASRLRRARQCFRELAGNLGRAVPRGDAP